MGRTEEQRVEESCAQTEPTNDATVDPQTLKFPRTFSLSHLWELDCLGSLPQLLNDNSYNSSGFDNYQNIVGVSENGPGAIQKFQFGEVPFHYMDSVKFEANHNKQPIFVNPVFQFEWYYLLRIFTMLKI